MDFDVAFFRLLEHEGGYANNPLDPGGPTNWGITQPTLAEAIRLKLVPSKTTVKNITREQAKTIYRELYWKRVKADKFSDGVAWQVFDFAVNSGVETAIRYLQRAIEVADDGIWGPVSQAKLERVSEPDVILRLCGLRLDFMTKLSNWPNASRGWARRIAENLLHGAQDT